MDRDVIARGVVGDEIAEPPRTLKKTTEAVTTIEIPKPVSRSAGRRQGEIPIDRLSQRMRWQALRRLSLVVVVTILICGIPPALVGLYVVTYNQPWAWLPGPLLALAGVLTMACGRRRGQSIRSHLHRERPPTAQSPRPQRPPTPCAEAVLEAFATRPAPELRHPAMLPPRSVSVGSPPAVVWAPDQHGLDAKRHLRCYTGCVTSSGDPSVWDLRQPQTSLVCSVEPVRVLTALLGHRRIAQAVP